MPHRLFARPFLSLAILAAMLSCGLSNASAQQSHGKKEKGPAYTTPPANDPSFPLMGEFAGKIRNSEDKKNKQQVALQIRPISQTQFKAIAYFGGLPGQPGHQEREMNLIGLRSENSLILSGGPWAIFVDPDGCNLIDSDGKMLGRLKRVFRVSPTLGAKPPEGAVVLFDGTNTDHFVNAKMTENGLLEQGALINRMFQDFNLHVEFRIPYMPQADGQQRGNSGLYLQSRYECQVLDSFGTPRLFNGLGALYRQKSPDVNMAFPPLRWQTYDIQFTAPRWASDGTKIRNAHITSWVNGVKVQDNVSLPSKTGAGKPEEPRLSPINIQDHGDPVRFRNIWIVDRGITTADFPVIAPPKVRKAAAELEWNVEPTQEDVPPQDSKSEQKKDQSESADKEPSTEGNDESDSKQTEAKSE